MASPIEEIKARLDVVDVIGQHVPLKRVGRNYQALCPFHNERTPSFVVFPETGTWRCFGCGAGGDVFHFVMQRQGLTFAEALQVLAAQAGVTLPSHEQQRQRADEHDRLYEVNEAAARYFRAMLMAPAGAAARAYLERRGVDGPTAERFGLGYAPEPRGAIAAHLQERGFSVDALVAAGLAGRDERGVLFERFRGRLIFPIRDARGRVVGFGARALGDEQPKYLNSPQTPVFEKGAVLYGLDLARESIRRGGQAVIVEGYMDVLAAHQHGFTNVVASLGTSVTPRQLELLRRTASEVCLALDADAAGQLATLRGLEVAREALADDVVPVPDLGAIRRLGTVAAADPKQLERLFHFESVARVAIKAVVLPDGRDPDDVIRADPERWRQLIDSARPFMDFLLETLVRQRRPETAQA
ncbi:MAG TPA: DNA primase, partial [Chloroflexota bacterium]